MIANIPNYNPPLEYSQAHVGSRMSIGASPPKSQIPAVYYHADQYLVLNSLENVE